MSANNASSAPDAQGKGKKKGAKFTPFPSVVAAESNLPWCVEYTTRVGRHAVAQEDIPAGTLVMLERPFLSVPMAKYATAVCHRCLEPLGQSAAAEAASKANPCLPRYCPACKGVPHEIDAKLAALRIKLPEIGTQNSLDPIMLHIITLLDLQRSGVAIDFAIPAPSDKNLLAVAKRETLPKVASGVPDFDTLPNLWDRKAENWRKKVGPAVRALHKELVALAESGAIPGYSPSPIIRLQTDAAAMSAHIQSFSAGTNSSISTGVGIFPTLSLFQQSCLPNAYYKTVGCQLMVRTIQDVAKGTPITVSYVNLTEPRANRQAILQEERHQTCACTRCVLPMKDSIDRLLEGVVCLVCRDDVLLEVPEGPENEAAIEDYKKRLLEDRETIRKAAAKRAAKGGKGKANGGKRSGKAEDGAEGEEEGKEEDTEEDFTAVPEGITFWRCCGCGNVESAHNVKGIGPGDVIANAGRLLEQGAMFLRLNHAELAQQGEAILEEVAKGLDGRLTVFHTFVLQALAPLVNINMKKGDSVKAMDYAIQLWDSDRNLVDLRPTMQQLQCLEAIIEVAEQKVAKASSEMVKRQYAKKLKLAMGFYKEARMILEGR